MIAGTLLVWPQGLSVISCADHQTGGAICGAFVVFGGLSVLLYRPWRCRIDKKRLGNSHFEALPQSPETAVTDEEEQHCAVPSIAEGTKDVHVLVRSTEAIDPAGPAHRQNVQATSRTCR